MNVLVLGGTRFVGRHLVQALLTRGDEVTLFNRGQSGAAPPGAVLRTGDRRVDLSALSQGEWDAVVDTCGYLPREVAASARLLAGRVGTYVFISTESVYASFRHAPTEDDPLATIDDPDTEVVDGRTYGALKALCEAEVWRHFPEAALVLRPGLIVGPHDPTQRFTYWPARLGRATRGEPVLAPGRPDAAVQWVDVRDLAAFIVELLVRRQRGTFNVVDQPCTMADLLGWCATAASVSPAWQWVDLAWLQAQGVEPWSDLPLVLPEDEEHAGFAAADATRARAAGFIARPKPDTVADTLAWWRSLPEPARGFDKAGLSPDRERALLAAWRA